MNRNLDGAYFRVKRGEKWENVCFSDLTPEEREKVCEGQSAEWFKLMMYHMADCLKQLGDAFNIACE